MKEDDKKESCRHCAFCRWAINLEHRYDHMHCINENSAYADSDVESTGTCPLFEHSVFSQKD